MICENCGSGVRPVVALDIDGTLARWHDHFVEFLHLWLPPDETQYLPPLPYAWNGEGEFSDWLELDKNTYRQAKLAFRQGGIKRWMKAYEGARSLTRRLQMLDAEIWVTTTRPWLSLDNIDPDTRHWLARHDISYDHLLFHDDKYYELIERVGLERIAAVVDDEREQIERARELGLMAVQRVSNWNAPPMPGPAAETLPVAADFVESAVRRWRANNE